MSKPQSITIDMQRALIRHWMPTSPIPAEVPGIRHRRIVDMVEEFDLMQAFLNVCAFARASADNFMSVGSELEFPDPAFPSIQAVKVSRSPHSKAPIAVTVNNWVGNNLHYHLRPKSIEHSDAGLVIHYHQLPPSVYPTSGTVEFSFPGAGKDCV